MAKRSNFSKKEGRQLAEEIATHIVENEQFQNWDECLREISDMVCMMGDQKYGIPVSSFVRAEELEKIRDVEHKSRYKIRVRNGEYVES